MSKCQALREVVTPAGAGCYGVGSNRRVKRADVIRAHREQINAPFVKIDASRRPSPRHQAPGIERDQT